MKSSQPIKSTFNSPKKFLEGLFLPAQGIRLILSKPSLIGLSAIPIIITSILYWFFFRWSYALAYAYLSSHLFQIEFFSGWFLQLLITLVCKAILILFFIFSFSSLGALIACPFNDFLAESTEKHVGLKNIPGEGLWGWARLISIDFIKSTFCLSITLLCGLLSWVPGLNFVAFGIALIMVCFQFLSYPQTRRKIGIQEGMRMILADLPRCLGFGLSLFGLFSIPLVSCFFLPVAVVSGTLLFSKLQDRSSQDPH